MELKKTYHISKILSKYFTGCITEAEMLQLEDWINVSARNKELFGEFSRKGFFEEKQLDEASVDLKGPMLEFMQRKATDQHKPLTRYFKYFAAATIVLIAGAAFLLFQQPGKNSERSLQDYSTIKEQITPGEKKAILTLANGQKVYLGDAATSKFIDQNIKITDSSLQYQHMEALQTLAYNELEVPKKSEFMLTLSDGTRVWLNSDSRFKYPTAFTGKDRRVQLEGEAYFEVSKREGKPFIVDMGENSVQVLGTSFNIKAYKSQAYISTTLVEGRVRLNTPGQSADLKPNEQGIINIKRNRITTTSVDVIQYIGWKNGRFVFDNQPLVDIMEAISRWYGIEVVFENEAARRVTFTGNIKRYDTLNKIINMLEMTQQIKFRKEGDTIYISK